MEIQDLQQRIVAINDEMSQAKALYMKLEGHLAETHHWLGEIIRKAQEKTDAENNAAVMDNVSGDEENGEIIDEGEEQTPQE